MSVAAMSARFCSRHVVLPLLSFREALDGAMLRRGNAESHGAHLRVQSGIKIALNASILPLGNLFVAAKPLDRRAGFCFLWWVDAGGLQGRLTRRGYCGFRHLGADLLRTGRCLAILSHGLAGVMGLG